MSAARKQKLYRSVCKEKKAAINYLVHHTRSAELEQPNLTTGNSSNQNISRKNYTTRTASYLPTENVCEPKKLCDSNTNDAIEDPDFNRFSSSDDEEIETPLKKVFVNNSLSHSTINELLVVLRQHSCFEHFPKDSRTFLGTPQHTNVKKLEPGEYLHFGLEKEICYLLESNLIEKLVDTIEIQLSVDGIPLAKSSSICFWPVLAKVVGTAKIFPIGIYCGKGKPKDVNEFMRETISEIILLEDDGLYWNSKKYSLKLKCIIADMPARAMITNTKGHSGRNSCLKCHIRGDYVQHRIVFPFSNAQLRTDQEFRLRADDDHHNGISELCRLRNDVVKTIVYEYMHLVCLGNMRKLIKLWMRGKQKHCKLSCSQITEISEQLIFLQRYTPREFQRKPRTLNDVDRWKATEFRLFLLYFGPVVLRKFGQTEFFKHFLVLHVAIRLLCDPQKHRTWNNYANDLLQYFVQHYATLYGTESMSANVHGLLHLPQDTLNHGVLDAFSAFPFESYLGKLKSLVKKSTCQLQQVHRRLEEQKQSCRNVCKHSSQTYSCALPAPTKYFPRGRSTVPSFTYNELYFSERTPDNCCVLTNGTILIIESIVSLANSEKVVTGRIIENTSSVYDSPLQSTDIGIFKCPRPKTLCSTKASNVMMEFAVVAFDLENSTAIVSSTWLFDNLSRVHWPPCTSDKALEHAVRRHLNPLKTWKSHPCRVLRMFDTYDNARKNGLAKATITSDLEESDHGKGMRKRRGQSQLRNPPSDGTSSDEEQQPLLSKRFFTLPQPPKPSSLNSLLGKAKTAAPSSRKDNSQRLMITRSSSGSILAVGTGNPSEAGQTSYYEENCTETYSVLQNAGSSQLLSAFGEQVSTAASTVCLPNGSVTITGDPAITLAPDTSFPSPPLPVSAIASMPVPGQTAHGTASSMPEGFTKYVYESLSRIIANQRDMKQDIQNLKLQSTCTTPIEDNSAAFPVVFPVSSQSDLEVLEICLVDEDLRSKIVDQMIKEGGSDLKDTIKRIMNEFITDEVLTQFSWKGNKGKKVFSTLGITKLIKDAVRRHINIGVRSSTNHQIESVINKRLVHASTRINNRVKSANAAIGRIECEPQE